MDSVRIGKEKGEWPTDGSSEGDERLAVVGKTKGKEKEKRLLSEQLLDFTLPGMEWFSVVSKGLPWEERWEESVGRGVPVGIDVTQGRQQDSEQGKILHDK